jgi:thymidylate synthase
MRIASYGSFQEAIAQASWELEYNSKIVHSARWQGRDIASKPEMATHEAAHISFRVQLPREAPAEDISILDHLRLDIGPNLPWADDHFEERVNGFPINPGTQWAKWPYGNSAATFLDSRGKFNHNYMERYWPKLAGLPHAATVDKKDWHKKFEEEQHATADMVMPRHQGISYNYGDLNDVVKLLAEDPYTRQAYLPMWFPEDTGGGSKRAPCTIGYHFLMRDGELDITYQIRSCDFIRHFRDDIYLTVRLLLWVIEQAAKLDDRWKSVVPGKFIMNIQSLHLFRNDYRAAFNK